MSRFGFVPFDSSVHRGNQCITRQSENVHVGPVIRFSLGIECHPGYGVEIVNRSMNPRYPAKYRVVFAMKYLGIALLLLGLIAYGSIVLVGLAILVMGAIAQSYLVLFGSKSRRRRD